MRRHNDRNDTDETNRQETSGLDDSGGPHVEEMQVYDPDAGEVLLLSECDPDTGLLQDRKDNGRWLESDLWVEVEK